MNTKMEGPVMVAYNGLEERQKQWI